MLNLSDKELDRLSKEAAQEYEPGEILGAQSWEKLEIRLDRDIGGLNPNPLRHVRRFPFYYAPAALLVVVGVSYYFLKHVSRHSGSPPASVVQLPKTSNSSSTVNPELNDKSTSTPAASSTASSDAAANGSSRSDAGGSADGSAASGSGAGSTSGSSGSVASGSGGVSSGSGAASGASSGSGAVAGSGSSAAGGSSRSSGNAVSGASGAAANGAGAAGSSVGGKSAASGDGVNGAAGASGARLNGAATGNAAGLNAGNLGHQRSNANLTANSRNRRAGNTNGGANSRDRQSGHADMSGGGGIDRSASKADKAGGSNTDGANNPVGGMNSLTGNANSQQAGKQGTTAARTGELGLTSIQGLQKAKKAPYISDSALRAFTLKSTAPQLVHQPGLRINRSLQFGVVLAPDYASVNSLAGDKAGSTIGLTVDYNFANRWYIGTGLLLDRKNYAANAKDYHAPPDFYRDYNMRNLDYVKGTFEMLEIPLNLRYDFSVTGNTLFFASTGISSYLLTSENNNYYSNPWGPRLICQTIPNPKTGNYLFSAATLSVGVETGLSNSLSLLIAPYVKMPVRNIGFGQVQMNTVGINFALKFAPVISRHR